MARSFAKKARNTKRRKQKPVMVVAAEGKNVTELQYILSFRSQHGKYAIHPHRTGHDTDPYGLLKSVEKYWRDNQLSKDLGDKAFILMDVDYDKKKADRFCKAIRDAEYAEFILSNPCFEVWYLFHFEKTTHVFLNGEEVIRRLKKHLPDYDKTTDVSSILKERRGTALVHAMDIKKYHEDNATPWPSADCNPMTDIPIIIRELIE